MIQESRTTIQTVPLSISASGDNIVIASEPNSSINIHSLWFVSGGTTTFQYKHGATAFSSVVPLASGDTQTLECTLPDSTMLYKCKLGEDFIINLGSAAPLLGSISYSRTY